MHLKELEPKAVFGYFEELTKIPRGSGNMDRISQYCVDFAEKNGLFVLRDETNNVVIKKPASKGYEEKEAIILQGHLDMVCQKDAGVEIDFLKDGVSAFVDGDFIRAKGTTLGADNGIAVAMILAILADNTLMHPPIEAVFTTDEEIGMVGAGGLDFGMISGRRMINLDSEDPSVVTVSCAGGSDFKAEVPIVREKKEKAGLEIFVGGLLGGHSGVEIDKGRVNASILMGRVLQHLKNTVSFEMISINGGDKGNAIPKEASAQIAVDDAELAKEVLFEYENVLRAEFLKREPNFFMEIKPLAKKKHDVITAPETELILSMLLCVPNGVLSMSAEIENLVETSLNLGVLQTEEDKIVLLLALRSNKESALLALNEKLSAYFRVFPCTVKKGGFYPPWEYKKDSKLRILYQEKFKEKFGVTPEAFAIHAGLECGIFASKIEGFDCISVGPDMKDIHTTNERLSISSSQALFELILEILKSL